jgi:hypothetical protein
VYAVASNNLKTSAAYAVTFELIVDVQNWTLTADDFWIMEDGEYSFGWTYDNSSELPFDPYVSCKWGGNPATADTAMDLSSPLFHTPNKNIYNLGHTWSAIGYYNVACTMSNLVSSQTLTKNVSDLFFPLPG